MIEVTGWSDTIWLTQQDRTDIDYAVFGQADFDITDKLTATFGVRYFWVDNSLKGFFGYGIGYADDDGDGPGAPDGSPSAGEDGCDLREPFGAPGPDYQGAPCLNLDKSVEQDDHSLKFGLQYELTDDKMIYATYAEGFRPGGINRRGSLPPYLPDFLDSYEVGWKTSWVENRLRFNGAVFYQLWKDFQFPILGANGLTEIKNAAEAEMTGIEADISWLAIDQLSLTAAVSFINAELTKPYCGFVDENNKPVAKDPCPTFDEDGNPITVEPEAPKGQQLPVTPEFKGNLTARYEFAFSDFDSYLQGALVYVGDRKSDLRNKTPEEALVYTERFLQHWKCHALIVPAVAPHAPYTNSADTLKAAKALADKYSLPMMIHVSETQDEGKQIRDRHGMTSTQWLDSLGVLGPNVVFHHGVWLSDDDLAILRRRGVNVSHNPESNMKLASGTAPVVRMLALRNPCGARHGRRRQ